MSEEDQEEFYDSSSKEATPETIDDGKGLQSSNHWKPLMMVMVFNHLNMLARTMMQIIENYSRVHCFTDTDH